MSKIIVGVVLAVVGALFVILSIISIITKKEIPIFKYLIARSKMLFKEKVYAFYIITGFVITILGVLCATGVIWQ